MTTITKDSSNELLMRAYASTKFFCQVILSDEFESSFSPLHEEIVRLIDGGHRKVGIAAPRGIGKTTFARAVAAKSILFNIAHFIVYLSNSATVAEMQTENLKYTLMTNPLIKDLWPGLKLGKDSGMDDSFSKKAWTAYGNTLILPRGAGQQVRGLNWRGYRPQLIIIDDLEDAEEVLSELNRQKTRNWFYADVEKSVNRYKNDWRMLYIDTLKHEDALLAELLEASDWKTTRLSICTEDYKSLVPDYISDSELEVEVQRHREAGTMDVFYMEMMNSPISLEDAVFKQSYFHHDREIEDKLKDRYRSDTAVIVDPAKTVKLHSAESGIIGVTFDPIEKRLYFRDLIGAKLHPDQLYDAAIDMCLSIGAPTLAVEVTSLNEFITFPFKNRIQERGVNIEFVELKARGKKEDRIAALAPLYRLGQIVHNPLVCGPLEQQLLSFPRSRRFDLMDAAAYSLELFEIGARYFEPDLYVDDSELPEPLYPKDDEPAVLNWGII